MKDIMKEIRIKNCLFCMLTLILSFLPYLMVIAGTDKKTLQIHAWCVIVLSGFLCLGVSWFNIRLTYDTKSQVIVWLALLLHGLSLILIIGALFTRTGGVIDNRVIVPIVIGIFILFCYTIYVTHCPNGTAVSIE